jgi:hypothetical protein
MKLSTAASGAALMALAGCGGGDQQGSPAPSASHSTAAVAQWCKDAHTLASEILAATALTSDELATWGDDAHTVNEEALAAPGNTGLATAQAALSVEAHAYQANYMGETIGLLRFQKDARKLAASC